MTCPYCGEGPIYLARVRFTGETVRICGECDTIWRRGGRIPAVTNYSAYAKARGQAPLWESLTLLSAIEEEKEAP